MNLHFKRLIRSFVLVCVCVCAQVPAFGQETAVGYVRFVNAIGLKGDMTLSMNGNTVNPNGYQSGEYTGGVGLKVGNYTFTFDHPLLEELEKAIQVVEGETVTYVAYVKPKLDEEGLLLGRELALHELEAAEKGGASVTALSLCDQRAILPLQFLLQGASAAVLVEVEPLKPRRVRLNRTGFFAMAFNKNVIASMTMEEPRNFAVAIFESTDKEGNPALKTAMFINEGFGGKNKKQKPEETKNE